ncbi:MAG TPA: hypothetical protein VEK73_10170 [Xanthobacteraceae bacterium]|nr:hypothetical protein [Xanthobacteraceae bacterium]
MTLVAGAPPDGTVKTPEVSVRLRVTALVLRALFLGTLVVLAMRVSLPQSETIWSAYETPGDFVRLGLGLAAGIGILVQLFLPPKDAHACRTWTYLGLFLTPLAVAVAIAVW